MERALRRRRAASSFDPKTRRIISYALFFAAPQMVFVPSDRIVPMMAGEARTLESDCMLLVDVLDCIEDFVIWLAMEAKEFDESALDLFVTGEGH